MAAAFVLVAGVVAAVSNVSLAPKRISLFGQEGQATDFTVTSLDPHLKGKNKIDVDLTLANGSPSAAHSASAEVQLLDASGNVILSQVLETGNVTGGGSASIQYAFTQAGLVAAYSSLQVVIEQSS